MHLFELVFMIAIGTLFCVFGWKIWKKEQIMLIHGYHHTKVKESDKKAYTNLMGKAMLLIGVGMYLTGIIDFITFTFYGWIAFGVSFIGALIIMILAQKRYNKGIF